MSHKKGQESRKWLHCLEQGTWNSYYKKNDLLCICTQRASLAQSKSSFEEALAKTTTNALAGLLPTVLLRSSLLSTFIPLYTEKSVSQAAVLILHARADRQKDNSASCGLAWKGLGAQSARSRHAPVRSYLYCMPERGDEKECIEQQYISDNMTRERMACNSDASTRLLEQSQPCIGWR